MTEPDDATREGVRENVWAEFDEIRREERRRELFGEDDDGNDF